MLLTLASAPVAYVKPMGRGQRRGTRSGGRCGCGLVRCRDDVPFPPYAWPPCRPRRRHRLHPHRGCCCFAPLMTCAVAVAAPAGHVALDRTHARSARDRWCNVAALARHIGARVAPSAAAGTRSGAMLDAVIRFLHPASAMRHVQRERCRRVPRTRALDADCRVFVLVFVHLPHCERCKVRHGKI
jgi:hypothetical protein